MPNSARKNLALTVLVTIVSGKNSLRRCLNALCPQIDFKTAEIVVPFDCWSLEIGKLKAEFPLVRFPFIEDLGVAASVDVSAHAHRLYDRRRAVGLNLARGRIVAMIEDHALPAADWCRQILALHEEHDRVAVIGGAIENAVDRPLNWAWYYCDFGRYGRPLLNNAASYVSDVNVSYKREALLDIQDVWREAYHETTVHWVLRSRGTMLFLDERMLVYQHRPPLSLSAALGERIAWGRVFAETRIDQAGFGKQLIFAAGTFFLPVLLFARVARRMRRQKRTLAQMTTVLPLVFVLLLAWSLGELLGYLNKAPVALKNDSSPAASQLSNNLNPNGFTG